MTLDTPNGDYATLRAHHSHKAEFGQLNLEQNCLSAC
jgi:hypothetical protein